MVDSQKQDFFSLMKATLEVYSQPIPSAEAMKIWWNALQNYDFQQVRAAFDEHIRRIKFAPKPSDILDALNAAQPDGRPGPDEAWAMIPRDEETSVVMTEEMAEAMHIAQPLLNEGDQVAARKSFLEAYTRLVDTRKRAGKPVRWFPSLGNDKHGREAVLAEAVRLGRLPANHAISLLPPEKVLPMLEMAGEEKLALEYKPSDPAAARANLARMKAMLEKKVEEKELEQCPS